MNLVTLHHSPQLHAFYDTWNNWLFLEWHGPLTLPGVQQSCLELLRCCCAYSCQRVLNSNTQVQFIAADVAPWVRQEFLPFLRQLGVEQLAWVWAGMPAGPQLVHEALKQPVGFEAAAFGELETAVEWLQDSYFGYVSGCAMPAGYPPQGRVRREADVEALITRLSTKLP